MITIKQHHAKSKQGKLLFRGPSEEPNNGEFGLVAGLICPDEGMELAPCRTAMQHQQVVKASSGHNPPPFLISDVKNYCKIRGNALNRKKIQSKFKFHHLIAFN